MVTSCIKQTISISLRGQAFNLLTKTNIDVFIGLMYKHNLLWIKQIYCVHFEIKNKITASSFDSNKFRFNWNIRSNHCCQHCQCSTVRRPYQCDMTLDRTNQFTVWYFFGKVGLLNTGNDIVRLNGNSSNLLRNKHNKIAEYLPNVLEGADTRENINFQLL